MAQPGVMVGRIAQIVPPPHSLGAAAGPGGARYSTVQLQGGGTCRLDWNDPRASVWKSVLDELRQGNEPAYLDVDPQSGVLRGVLIPELQYVERVAPQPDDGRHEVEFSDSHARHFLPVASPDYAAHLTALRSAADHGTPVLVSETIDTHEVVDVRPPTAPFPLAPGPVRGPAVGAAAERDSHACTGLVAVSTDQARYLFDLASGPACSTVSPAPPCIPFAYPDDGCWARANEMARIMMANGLTPCKIWSYGRLTAQTRYNSTCAVHWSWHVAPCLLVDTDSGSQVQVIDPSMFTEPVARETWLGAQGDLNVTAVMTDVSVYQRTVDGRVIFDPTFVLTNQILTRYRLRLALLATSASGPPPYAQCPLPYPDAP